MFLSEDLIFKVNRKVRKGERNDKMTRESKSKACLLQFCLFSFSDSRAYLHASRDLHVQTGSQLTLSCAVKRSSGEPDYVYWYRNEDVLNYSPHVKIEDAASPEEQPLVSKLSVENVQKSHSGNYTCAPSNASPASVMVHVVDGNY